jgi:two-component system OmpR family sensor kinase
MIQHRLFSRDLYGSVKHMFLVFWHFKWHMVATLVPLIVGSATVAVLIAGGQIQDVIIEIASPLSEWAIYVGLVLSMLIAAGLIIWGWEARVHRQAITTLEAQAADDRRSFFGRLDHELKTPLTVIRTGVENLAAAAPERARQEALPTIRTQIECLDKLVTGLRKLTKLETQPLDLAPVVMTELLQQVVADARKHPDGTQDRPSLSLPVLPLPVIIGDEHLLLLTIHNVVDNALKFTQREDRVAVRAFADEKRVIIEVSDTGSGIPEVEKPDVWKELFRGQDARRVPGSGLGLTLVRAVVLRHGGRVSLESEVGRGTIVKIRLPVGDSAEL